ncbi:membrane hypothetical protein [Vibrio nigripulchritudo MADA3029]|uniref:helix-turn-helix domain-containing protein n=1 Tax=Vibrio nigripulchritudo TaxID=28173 RepID=UPI0003B23034|nr:helix-turn-helix transcriptional regulator [Vibrio nigripulchritudo]CCN47359.1 membrane hypothetical protein [Vibrio nigripulchritudo MADA3020]CCN55224.1 membrane hypothetical protein [Vibrio nigripulchritudo MADA3021]CCN61004.1 membrane hypothetical protein [Vibrio nigripulchritudo MADA3029]
MITAILLAGFIQSLVLAGFLYQKSRQHSGFWLLMVIHIVLAADLGMLFAQEEQWISHRINACWGVLYAILFYVFIRTCLKAPPSKFHIFLYFLPWVLINLSVTDFLFDPHSAALTQRHILAGYGFLALYVVYTAAAFFTVYHYQVKQEDFLANLSQENLRLLWGICVSLLLAIATTPIQIVFDTELPLPYLLMSLIMFGVTYLLLLNPQLLEFDRLDVPTEPISPQLDEVNIALEKQLLNLLDTQRMFTDPDLSLQSLADRLGVKSYLLSQVLNQHMGVKFYELVNRRRVNYVCELMKNQPHKPILDLALEAGFNSKSTFNAAFKKYQDKTPTQFKAALNSMN